MNKFSNCKRAAALIIPVFLCSVINTALWILEVFFLKGWEGLTWITTVPVAVFPVSLVAAAAVQIGIRRNATHDTKKAMLLVPVNTMVFLVCFLLCRKSLLELLYVDHLGILGGFTSEFVLNLILLFSTPLLFSFFLFLAYRLIYGEKKHALLWAPLAGVGTALLLSYATIKIIPSYYRGYTDFIHAFKMGYPCFWITLLVPFAYRFSLLSYKKVIR